MVSKLDSAPRNPTAEGRRCRRRFVLAAALCAFGLGVVGIGIVLRRGALERYWIRVLERGDEAERMRAARALGAMRSVSAVGPLLRAARNAWFRAWDASGRSMFFFEEVEEQRCCYAAIRAVGDKALSEVLRLMVEGASVDASAAEMALHDLFLEDWEPAWRRSGTALGKELYYLEVLRRDPMRDRLTRRRAQAAYEGILRAIETPAGILTARSARRCGKQELERLRSLAGRGTGAGGEQGPAHSAAERRDRAVLRSPLLAWDTGCGASGIRDERAEAAAFGDGTLHVVGSSFQEQGSSDAYLVLAYSSDGSMLWAARENPRAPEGSHDYDRATAVTLDAAGNACVTGVSCRENSGKAYATVKYAPDGRRLWATIHDDRGLSQQPKLAVDAAGAVFVSGSSWTEEPSARYVTIKYSPDGKELWRAYWTPDGREISEAQAIAAGPDGGVCVTGSRWRRETGMDICTVKYSPEGKELWSAVYGGPGRGPDVPNAVPVDGGGSVYVAGVSWGGGTDFDSVVIKYSAEGSEIWAARYNGPASGWDAATAIAIDSAGAVYVAGHSFGGDTGNDYLTIQYSQDGQELWVARYDGPGGAEDEAEYVVLDGKGGVYVGGRSSIADVGAEYCVVKYSSGGGELWVAPYRCWTLPGVEAGQVQYGELAGMAVDGRGARNGRELLPRRILGAASPTERVVTGHIGVGGTGTGHLANLKEHRGAICDVDENHLRRAPQLVGRYVPLYRTLRSMLDQRDIDAVFIATPDHWHGVMTIYACETVAVDLDDFRLVGQTINEDSDAAAVRKELVPLCEAHCSWSGWKSSSAGSSIGTGRTSGSSRTKRRIACLGGRTARPGSFERGGLQFHEARVHVLAAGGLPAADRDHVPPGPESRAGSGRKP